MKVQGQSRILANIVSPTGLALFSYAVFWFACLLPPSVYSRFLDERDSIFLDSETIIFYTSCVAGFLLGAWFGEWLMPVSVRPSAPLGTKISSFSFLLIPLVCGIAFAVYSDYRLVSSSPALILLLLAQQGQDVKNSFANEIQANVTLPPLLLTGIIWWAFWRYSDLPLSVWRKRVLLMTFFLAMLAVLASSVLTLSRSLLMSALAGTLVLYVTRMMLKGKINLGRAVRSSMLLLVVVPLLFFSFSYLRGSDDLSSQIQLLFGYTIASYNRLAAIVHGSLRFPFAGKGIYLSGFLAFNKSFNAVVPINKVLALPSPIDVFASPFSAISRASLDGTLVWPGAFGDIFSELGWFSCFFVMAYGLLYGVVWNWLKRGKVVGVVLYPMFAFAVLFWFGGNLLLGSDTAVLTVLALALAGYEGLLVRAVKTSSA